MEIVKTYKLFLDDIRNPIDAYSYTKFELFLDEDWIIVRNYTKFIEYIQFRWNTLNAFPIIIAFDHDLDDQHYGADVNSVFTEKTGMDCAKWLVDFCIDNDLTLPHFVCHSMNPAGRDNINKLLENFRKHQSE